MKLLILNLMILVSTNVFAHSVLADSFLKLPVGTEFVVKKSMILKKQTRAITFIDGQLYTNTEKQPSSGLKCVFYYESAEYDRELVVGESFLRTITPVRYSKTEIVRSELSRAHFHVYLEQENNPLADLSFTASQRLMVCAKLATIPPFDDFGADLSIGEAQRALGNYFEIH